MTYYFYPIITALIVFKAGATPNEIVTTFVDVTTAQHCTIALSAVLRTWTITSDVPRLCVRA